MTTTAKRNEPRVPFGALVERGLLRPGEVLEGPRGQTAKVRADGTLVTSDHAGSIHQVGAALDGDSWKIGITNPFDPDKLCGRLALREGAVATSGNYRRFSVIDGKRYSHILDPRTGRPTDAAASVTVIAPDCTTADVWATALSVLGTEGLKKVEAIDGLEAMMIVGTPDDHRIEMTSGFKEYLAGGKPITLD